LKIKTPIAINGLISNDGSQGFAMEEIKIIVDEFFEKCKAWVKEN